MKLLKSLQWVAIAILLLGLGACSTLSGRTFHSFELDPVNDSPDSDLLFYRYGHSNEQGLQTRQHSLDMSGGRSSGVSITGDLPIGDDLYMKWRDRKTGQVYEDTVDLKSRLPFNMRGKRIKPIVEGSQLYVYLIAFEEVRPVFSYADADMIRRYATTPRQKALSGFGRYKVLQIYPVFVEDPQLPPNLKK